MLLRSRHRHQLELVGPRVVDPVAVARGEVRARVGLERVCAAVELERAAAGDDEEDLLAPVQPPLLRPPGGVAHDPLLEVGGGRHHPLRARALGRARLDRVLDEHVAHAADSLTAAAAPPRPPRARAPARRPRRRRRSRSPCRRAGRGRP